MWIRFPTVNSSNPWSQRAATLSAAICGEEPPYGGAGGSFVERYLAVRSRRTSRAADVSHKFEAVGQLL